MKRGLISLLIAIFFALLVVFITANYSPFSPEGLDNIIQRYGITEEAEFREILTRSIELGVAWEFINIQSLVAWILAVAGFVIFGFASIHLTIDKLFFKQYYEKPDILPAIRRGTLFFFVIFVLFMLQLLGAFVWYTVLITVLLLGLFEYVAVYFGGNKKNGTKF